MEMANKHMEARAEEFNEMRRIGLFTVREIQKLIKKQSDFECKIVGVNKDIRDFKAYIQHEKDLLEDIKSKRQNLKIVDKKGGIEFRIMKRIKHIYEIALQRFSHDYPLCLSYFKFCKTINNSNAAGLAIQNILKNYSQNPEVWKLAAKFYAYDKRDKKMAVGVLLKGLNIHKDNSDLYKEAIKLELSDLSKSPPSEQTPDEIKKDKLVEEKIKSYWEMIHRDIKDLHFHIEILELLEDYPSTIQVQNLIVQTFVREHYSEAVVWHTLAQRELNSKVLIDNQMPSVKQTLEHCFAKYKQGLNILTGEQRTELWHLYLDCLIALQSDRKVAYQLKIQTLQSAFEEICQEDILTEKHYVVWIEILDTLHDEADTQTKRGECQEQSIAVLEKGLESIPQSVELWKLRLKAAIMTDNENEVNVVLKKAVMVLKEKASPIWLMALRFHILVSEENKIDEFYQGAIQQPPEVANIFKPQYIQWLGLSRDIAEIRSKYNILAQELPYCKELHAIMDKVESNERQPNLAAWERVHKNACNQFGENEVDVWISYAQFLSQYRPQDVPKIYKEAESKLTPLLFSEFQEKYLRLEEYSKISATNPAENIFNMLTQVLRKKCRAEPDFSDFGTD